MQLLPRVCVAFFGILVVTQLHTATQAPAACCFAASNNSAAPPPHGANQQLDHHTPRMIHPVWGHLWLWACGMWCLRSVRGVWGSVLSLQTITMESWVLRPSCPQSRRQDVGWNGIWILRVRLQPDCLPQAQYTKRPGLVRSDLIGRMSQPVVLCATSTSQPRWAVYRQLHSHNPGKWPIVGAEASAGRRVSRISPEL